MSAFAVAIREHREKTQSRKSVRQQLNTVSPSLLTKSAQTFLFTPHLTPFFLPLQDGGEESESVPLGHLAPPWLPDSAVSMCQLCSVQFTVTRRRHHCRACGQVSKTILVLLHVVPNFVVFLVQIFCKDCSSYLAPLRYKSDKLGRVCQSCYESICGT